MKFTTLLARKYLSSPEKSKSLSLLSWVSIIGLVLGVSALVIVISVMGGFQASIENATSKMTGDVVISEFGSVIKDKDKIDAVLKDYQKYIKSVIPVVYGEGMVVSMGGVRGVLVEGVELKSGEERIPGAMVQSWNSRNGVIVGSILAEELGMNIGDEIKLVIPFAQSGGEPKIENFKVVSIFQAGMHAFDAKYIYIPFKTAQEFFRLGSAISAYRIYLHKPSEIEMFFNLISEELPLPISIRTWKDYNRNLVLAIGQQKVVIALLLISIIIVAAFNVASSLFMLVMEKQKAISVLRAVGASKASIAKIFLSVGLFLGLFGTFGGIFFGLLTLFFLKLVPIIKLPPEVYHFKTLPVSINYFELLKISFVSISISLLATLYPALRASRLSPIEGIRYE